MSIPSWPTSLLNASNRRLREEIEAKTAALAALERSCSESRTVIELLKSNTAEVEKERRAAAKTAAEVQARCEAQATELSEYAHQIDVATRQRKEKEETYGRLCASQQHVTNVLHQRRQVLALRLQESKELEEVAKAVIEYSLARQRKGEALEAAKKKLSSSVWQKLDRLHAEIAKLERELAASQEEQESAFRELTVVQQRLHETLRDHRDNVGSLEQVHRAHRDLDAAIVACSAKMAGLQTIKATYTRVQHELTEALEKKGQEGQHLARARDRARLEYDRRVLQLRNVVETLHDQAVEIDAVGRRHRVEAQRRSAQSQAVQLADARLADEHATLLQQQEYHRVLSETVKLIQRELTQHPVPAPEAIQALFDTLDRQRSRVEDRLERMQVKLNAAVQEFLEVGKQTETITCAIADQQTKLKLSSYEVAEHQEIVQQLRALSSSIDSDLASAQAGLPKLMAKQAEQGQQRRTELEMQIASLRDDLHQHQSRHRQLLQETTTLRSQYMHAQRRLSEEDETFRRVHESGIAMERDLSAVAAEASAVEQRHRAVGMTAERTGVTLRALMEAADAQLDVVKESAGLGELLRAEVMVEEEKIEAERQKILLELHLQQNALHEHTDALQRSTKKRELIRQRYEETMAAMSRAMDAPLRTESTAEGAAMMPSTLLAGAMGTGNDALTTPEALHARLILRRSYEREQLMRRGNTLDLHLLRLEKETTALRRTLDTLRVECQQRPVEAVAALKRRARSVTHFGADRTNRPQSLRALSTHAKDLRHEQAPAPACTSPDTTRSQVALTNESQARSRALRDQVTAESEAASALSRCRVDSKRQLATVRRTLAEARTAERQKQMQLQRLRDDVRREHLKAIHSVK